jgi:hypothetical protein
MVNHPNRAVKIGLQEWLDNSKQQPHPGPLMPGQAVALTKKCHVLNVRCLRIFEAVFKAGMTAYELQARLDELNGAGEMTAKEWVSALLSKKG